MIAYPVSHREVHATIVRHGHCPRCGARATRQATFTTVIGPDNPVSIVEGQAQAAARGEGWCPDFTHVGCAPKPKASH